MRKRVSKRKSSSSQNWKINILVVGQLLVAVLFIFRLFQIQVLNHEKYQAIAEEQYWGLQEIPARRGDILSRDGYTLASTQVSYLMYAEPDKIPDPLQVSHDLADVMTRFNSRLYDDTEQKEAYQKSVEDHYYEVLSLDLKWIALEHYLDEEQKTEILKLGIEGIAFEEEPKRYYPEGELAAHVLGFVAKNEGGEEQGYFGVEGNMNGDLRGKPGKIIEERDATGAPILVGGYSRVNPIDGRNIVLTINRPVQYLVEKKLEEGVRKFGAASGSVVVMDPFTGDIIAMANFPTYHPEYYNEDELSNDLETQESQESQETDNVEGDETTEEDPRPLEYGTEKRNYSISQTYEPGSVMKPFTVAAGIDLKKITPETTFEDEGPVQYSDYVIDNWDKKHHGTQTIIQLLQKSNNIGAAWVGHAVGSKNLNNYLGKFGFGKTAGVDLEGEDTGIIRPYKDWTDIDLATISFGQGISATPLQVLNGFNALANGGDLMRPRIVEKVMEGDEVIKIPVKKLEDVISQKSSETMVYMLTEAVSGGESKYFNIENYKIAGKTGTAQIPVDGKYDPDLTNATFAGFPAESKKFSMIVKLEKPSTSVYASETAVPLWMDIAEDLLKYYGIAPDF